tara:strand:+ start:2409 stop:2804 length:396 start_codon:yes stop_codon:yes gene_type:complete
MKLNGKIYITKKQVITELEEVILDVELRNFERISTDLDDLDSNELDSVLQLLEAAKYDIGLLFKVTKYYSVYDMSIKIDEMKYDPKKEAVALHKFGAYGIKSKAGAEEIKKYGFNISLSTLNKRIQKYNNS